MVMPTTLSVLSPFISLGGGRTDFRLQASKFPFAKKESKPEHAFGNKAKCQETGCRPSSAKSVEDQCESEKEEGDDVTSHTSIGLMATLKRFQWIG